MLMKYLLPWKHYAKSYGRYKSIGRQLIWKIMLNPYKNKAVLPITLSKHHIQMLAEVMKI